MANSHPRSGWIDDALFPQRLLKVLKRIQPTPSKSTRVHYIYDLIKQQTLYSTGSVAALLGYGADVIHEMGVSGLATLIYPEDLNRVAQHYQKFYTLHYGEVIAIKYRMRRADGGWSWLFSQETLLISEPEEAPSLVLGMIELLTLPCPDHSGKLRVLSRFFRRQASSSKCPYPV